MQIVDLNTTEGRRYPARRRTRNLVGGAAAIQARNFSMGFVVLDPQGGQVPWHNQEQEEVYFVIQGTGEMCLGDEKQTVTGGQAVFIPPGVFHQMTNVGDTPCRCSTATARRATSPTGSRNWRGRSPKPAPARPRCPRAPAPSTPTHPTRRLHRP